MFVMCNNHTLQPVSAALKIKDIGAANTYHTNSVQVPPSCTAYLPKKQSMVIACENVKLTALAQCAFAALKVKVCNFDFYSAES